MVPLACLGLGLASCSLIDGQASSTSVATATSTVVFLGDSLAEQVAPYLQPLLGARTFVPQFFGGTAPCDWVGEDLQAPAASVVVISFTGNSLTACMSDGAGGFLHGQALVDKYRADIGALVAQMQQAGAHALLVGQPARNGGGDDALEVTGINQVYTDLVTAGGASFVDAGAAVEDAGGQYVMQLPCLPGEAECGPDGSNVIRSDDGVHFCPGPNLKPCPVYSSGAFRFATAIAAALDAL